MADLLRQHLARVAFEGIEFPCVEFVTTWGHDKAAHQGLLAPADLQTTGPKPLAIHAKAIFIDSLRNWPSNLFPDVCRQLLDALLDNPLGTLTHPTRGNLEVHVDDVGEPINVRLRNGVYVDLAFTAQGDPARIFIGNTDAAGATNTDPAATMLARAQDADDAGALLGAPPLPVLSIVNGALDAFGAAPLGYAAALSQRDAVLSAVLSALGAPGLATVDGHDARVALEALRAATYAFTDAYLGAASAPRVIEVAVEMSLARIAGLPTVYGDPSKASVLLQANDLLDPVFVPAGTRLLVPDL